MPHQGEAKTRNAARGSYYWVNMDEQIIRIVKDCGSCAVFGRSKQDKGMKNNQEGGPRYDTDHVSARHE